jgi:Methyltransferase domain
MTEGLRKLKMMQYYAMGKGFMNSPFYIKAQQNTAEQLTSLPRRTEVINFILSTFPGETTYLEIGVRNPADNYAHIKASKKYSVDPGIEFKENPVDFKVTSDSFFDKVRNNELLTSDIKFDVIFIDGLHLAEQVDRDIRNALDFIKEDGYIIMHDCNPPTEWHAREEPNCAHTPAGWYWNGTTWKAFLKWRFSSSVQSCCIDTDWGVGVLSRNKPIGNSINETNPFFEFNVLASDRNRLLNLVSFSEFKNRITGNSGKG